MSLALVALVFGIVLLAELPDKTMFASLMLGTRFAGRWVFIGAAAAFVVHVTIAVTAGGLLGLLPHRLLEFIIAVLFLLGAAFMLREARKDDDDDQGEDVAAGADDAIAWTAITSSFLVIFIGEWGDITQIATANLAAKYQQPLAVGIGATLGLWTAALIAITAGRTLLRVMSVTLLHRVGAAVFLVLATYSVLEGVKA